MRVIEHRRHSMRTPPGAHLTQAGVELARAVGNGMGRFELVITSTLPRAFETAIAMGFAVDDLSEELSSLPEGFEDEVPWDAGYAGFAAAAARAPEGVVGRFMRVMREFHVGVADRLQADGRALIVSHGGIVEASAIGCLSGRDLSSWGPPVGYCRGFRISIDEQGIREGENLSNG